MPTPLDRQEDLERVATAAAVAAAKLFHDAALASHQVTQVAASAAQVLAESTRLDLNYIKEDLRDIKTRLDHKYVTAEAFEPVRKLVFGLVTLILVSVVGGLLALVLKQ